MTWIDYYAFEGCVALEKFYCKAVNPRRLRNYIFSKMPRPKIYVPAESVSDYQREWTNYEDYIVGYDFEDIDR